jgi:hypothetical protein
VFVGGAASVALLPRVVAQKRAATWAAFAACNLLLVTTFAAHYLTVGRSQLAAPAGRETTASAMRKYWQHGFPPGDAAALPLWLLSAHTGQMAAYPVGAAAGGSVLTVGLCLVGGRRLWRRRRWLLGLFAALFALGLIAAALRGYPYGASCRLAQHLAPAYCLLAGLGLSVLLAKRRRAFAAVLIGLALLGVGGIGRDLLRPYRDDESRWAAALAADLEARAGGEPIVVRLEPETSPTLRWQLVRRGASGGEMPPEAAAAWVVSEEARPIAGWRRVESESATLPPSRPLEPTLRVVVERWERRTEHPHPPAGTRTTRKP